jgi:hypothetical protein
MTQEEQNVFLSRKYAEAIRYMDSAKDVLQKARKEDDGLYRNRKYVRIASGTAYNGMLVALDAWLNVNGVATPKRHSWKSVFFYKGTLPLQDDVISDCFDKIYGVLHWAGYREGVRDAELIEAGFKYAYTIIDKIKPENPVEVKDTKINAAKRAIKRMRISFAVMFK